VFSLKRGLRLGISFRRHTNSLFGAEPSQEFNKMVAADSWLPKMKNSREKYTCSQNSNRAKPPVSMKARRGIDSHVKRLRKKFK
jgi:hypothetical protein